MLSYEGVIRKRLRIKGHPEIPPYERGEDKATILASADIEPDAPRSEARPADEGAVDADDAQYDDVDEVEPAVDNIAEVIGVQEVKDKRTEAQKQHDEILQKRETELLRKAAAKSHKEQVEVCCAFLWCSWRRLCVQPWFFLLTTCTAYRFLCVPFMTGLQQEADKGTRALRLVQDQLHQVKRARLSVHFSLGSIQLQALNPLITSRKYTHRNVANGAPAPLTTLPRLKKP